LLKNRCLRDRANPSSCRLTLSGDKNTDLRRRSAPVRFSCCLSQRSDILSQALQPVKSAAIVSSASTVVFSWEGSLRSPDRLLPPGFGAARGGPFSAQRSATLSQPLRAVKFRPLVFQTHPSTLVSPSPLGGRCRYRPAASGALCRRPIQRPPFPAHDLLLYHKRYRLSNFAFSLFNVSWNLLARGRLCLVRDDSPWL
jgi:hypothetical protein